MLLSFQILNFLLLLITLVIPKKQYNVKILKNTNLYTLILVVASFLLIFLSISCMLGSKAASNSSFVVSEMLNALSFNPEKPIN